MGERNDDVMATITLGYTTFCMPLEDAVAIAKALTLAELYDRKYRSDGGTTHHIYPNEDKANFQLNFVTAELYRMAKLAGKPAD
jgi:hypothetical protein